MVAQNALARGEVGAERLRMAAVNCVESLLGFAEMRLSKDLGMGALAFACTQIGLFGRCMARPELQVCRCPRV